MKKFLSLVVVAVVLFCTFGFSAFALTTAEDDYLQALYVPDSIRAYKGDYITLLTPNSKFPASPLNSDNIEISEYGDRDTRTLYKTVLSERLHYDFIPNPSFAGNTLEGRCQVIYSSVSTDSPYWLDDFVGFPLSADNGSTTFSSPFTDDCSVLVDYSDVYLDTTSTPAVNALSFSFRSYVELGGQLTRDEALDFAQHHASYMTAFVEIVVQTNGGAYRFAKNIIPTVVGVSEVIPNGSTSLFYVTLYYDLYTLLYESSFLNNVVLSDGVSYFPSVELVLVHTTDTRSWDTRSVKTSYVFGYNSYTVHSDYNPIHLRYKFDNNVTLRPADFVDWIAEAVDGFLSPEIIPGIALGGLLAIIVAISVAMWVLKLFAGG